MNEFGGYRACGDGETDSAEHNADETHLRLRRFKGGLDIGQFTFDLGDVVLNDAIHASLKAINNRSRLIVVDFSPTRSSSYPSVTDRDPFKPWLPSEPTIARDRHFVLATSKLRTFVKYNVIVLDMVKIH